MDVVEIGTCCRLRIQVVTTMWVVALERPWNSDGFIIDNGVGVILHYAFRRGWLTEETHDSIVLPSDVMPVYRHLVRASLCERPSQQTMVVSNRQNFDRPGTDSGAVGWLPAEIFYFCIL